jgi:APA family basic amino acid/polyamine antiporter
MSRTAKKKLDRAGPREEPRRELGVWSASAIVVGSMVGAGVFTTSGFALGDLGAARWVLLAWVLGGVIAMAGALSYGGLVTRIPRSGGEYTFLSEVFHPLCGFLAGWVSLVAGFTGPIAAAALAFESYLNAVFVVGLPERIVGSGLILSIGVLHGWRSRTAFQSLRWTVGLKLFALLAFIAWSASQIFGQPIPVATSIPSPEIGAFAVTLVWISFSYSGWNGAVYLAGEIREPERNLVRSLWYSTAAMGLVYVALNAVFLASAPAEALVGRYDIAAVAAEHLGGPALRRAVALLVALALFTSVSSMMAAGPRVYAQMARDGYLPGNLVATKPGATPTRAVVLQTLLSVAVVWTADLLTLLATLGFVLSLSSALSVVAAWRLRVREGAARVPIPLFPWTPLLYIAATIGSAGYLVVRAPVDALIGVSIVLSGLPVYFYMTHARKL